MWRFMLFILCLMFCVLLPIAALFSQVAVLAAVLALVVIVIMSFIILIAIWRKVRETQTSFSFHFSIFLSSKAMLFVLRNLAMRSDGR